VLLALSTNSPFWRGEATGLPSPRAMIFAAFPRSGISPRFESYQDYADAVGFMEATGAIGDYTHLWWDVRPHPRFGTVERRVMAVQTRADGPGGGWGGGGTGAGGAGGGAGPLGRCRGKAAPGGGGGRPAAGGLQPD